MRVTLSSGSRLLATALLGILLLGACTSKSSAYYVDCENGDDANDGRSPATAWRTLDRAGRDTLRAGESLLLRKGQTFHGQLNVTGIGTEDAPVLVSGYGDGPMPVIQGGDSTMWALRVRNSQFLTVRALEIVNTGKERLPARTGLFVECADYGVSTGITIDSVYIHDVNGSLIKRQGGGSGIHIVNHGREVLSRFDRLTITNCHIQRCERNAMIWDGNFRRDRWFPNTNVVVRGNLIEQVPGDGIVPIGCDGTLIEYNVMRDCPDLLPPAQAAAGIWPWSCDNTVIQFNEVSDHKAPSDAQGYDCDYNCTGTVIRYNYSHDNHGGLVLVCDAGGARKDYSIGNDRSRVEYNISIGDGIRPRDDRGEMFSPSIHIGGRATNTFIGYNIIHANPRPDPIDRTTVCSEAWDGYADSTTFSHNVFYVADEGGFIMSKSTNNVFTHNWFLGTFKDRPEDGEALTESETYRKEVLDVDPTGYKALEQLMDEHDIRGYKAHFVNEAKIKAFFEKMEQ